MTTINGQAGQGVSLDYGGTRPYVLESKNSGLFLEIDWEKSERFARFFGSKWRRTCWFPEYIFMNNNIISCLSMEFSKAIR